MMMMMMGAKRRRLELEAAAKGSVVERSFSAAKHALDHCYRKSIGVNKRFFDLQTCQSIRNYLP